MCALMLTIGALAWQGDNDHELPDNVVIINRPGDIDGDGDIDLRDQIGAVTAGGYLAARNGMGTRPVIVSEDVMVMALIQGDVTGDGFVDHHDYSLLWTLRTNKAAYRQYIDDYQGWWWTQDVDGDGQFDIADIHALYYQVDAWNSESELAVFKVLGWWDSEWNVTRAVDQMGVPEPRSTMPLLISGVIGLVVMLILTRRRAV